MEQKEQKQSIKLELSKIIYITVQEVFSEEGQKTLPSLDENIFNEFKKVNSTVTENEFLSMISTIFRVLLRLDFDVTQRVTVEAKHLIRFYNSGEESPNLDQLVELEMTDLIHEILVAFFTIREHHETNVLDEDSPLKVMASQVPFKDEEDPHKFVACFQSTLSLMSAIGFDNDDKVDVYF